MENNLIEKFCANNNIKHIYIKPHSPQSNEAVEASPKQIKRLVFDKYYTSNEKEEFDLEDAILSVVNFHNNTIHRLLNINLLL